MKRIVGRLKQRLGSAKVVLCDSTGLSVVELILILVDIYIMGERYIYCEWR